MDSRYADFPYPGHRRHPGSSYVQPPPPHEDRIAPFRVRSMPFAHDAMSDVTDVALRHHGRHFSSGGRDFPSRLSVLDLEQRPSASMSGVRESRGEYYSLPGTDAHFYGAAVQPPFESLRDELAYRAQYRPGSDVLPVGPGQARHSRRVSEPTQNEIPEFGRMASPQFGRDDGFRGGQWRTSGSEVMGEVTRTQPAGFRSRPSESSFLDRRRADDRSGLWRDSRADPDLDPDDFVVYSPGSERRHVGRGAMPRGGSSRSSLVVEGAGGDPGDPWGEGSDVGGAGGKPRLSACAVLLRLVAAILIVGDAGVDWYFMLRLKTLGCGPQLSAMTSLAPMCGLEGKEILRRIMAAFVVMGTASATVQLISLFLETLRDCGNTHFRFCHPLLELYAVIFLEELPQAVMALLFTETCTCSESPPWGVFFAFYAVLLGLLSAAVRFCTSYRKLCGRHGCCNSWWRCCCCRDTDVLVHATWRTCCCQCDIPLPPCCCTLRCTQGKGKLLSWFQQSVGGSCCTCGSCQGDPGLYGARLVVVVGMATQLACAVVMAIRFADAW